MKISLVFLFSILFNPARGQDNAVSRLLEHISMIHDENVNYEQLTEQLQDLLENPIDLLSAGSSDLEQLWILSPEQIRKILDYRDHQDMISLYELQVLPGLETSTLELILPFLYLKKISSPLLDRGIRPTHYFILRMDRSLQKKKGFLRTDSLRPYPGSPEHLLLRYRLNYPGKLSMGLNFEKDEGERLIWHPHKLQLGADHVNFHVQLKRKTWSLLLGDFRVQFGQGLTLGGAGFNLGKGSDAILGIKRNDVGIRPHNSMTEFGFFRGVAASCSLGSLKAHFMVSSIMRDAGSFQLGDKSYFNLRSTGLHRTQTELGGRKQIRETVLGLNINYKWKKDLELGLNVVSTGFSNAVGKNPSTYNQYSFLGKQQSNLGLYMDLGVENINAFSEMTLDLITGSMAWIAGALVNLSEKLEWSVHWRQFPKDFISLYGNAFSEKQGQQNENGLYMGFQCKVSRKQRFAVYIDQFRFPWLRFQATRPSEGYEIGAFWEKTLSSGAMVQFRYRKKHFSADVSDGMKIRHLGDFRRQQLRLSISKDRHPLFGFQWHLQWNILDQENNSENGIMLAQDIRIDPIKNLRLKARFSLFDTHSFDTRLYAYESDVLYAFSIPSWSGTGIRYYFLLRYKLNRDLGIWIKFASALYNDRFFIGSGNDRIEGNKKQDLKVQLKYTF